MWKLALVRTGSRADADDVYQDVFLRLACDGTEFADEGHLKAWLLRVTINRCRELSRMAWRRRNVSLDALTVEPSDPQADGEFDAAEIAELWQAVGRLKAKYREVIHLRYREELSCEQIAHVLGTNVSTVRTRLQRAHKQLEAMLGGQR
ncbi:MAG: sigma-70 family RNA polymerase sigma factor [Coriobacteriia bacterium]|nr:sigma-70 family RNA polymerase sigma factor [Coriobacteriia bacterium]MBS5478139.1 sigma-70 family RNA polymerase sigma factor [Coriobacteriia bacterium]